MNPLSPIALVQSTDAVRRAVRGSGPAGAAEDARERAERTPWLRALRRRRAAAAGPEPALAQAAQSGSDQCRIVAAGRKPARA